VLRYARRFQINFGPGSMQCSLAWAAVEEITTKRLRFLNIGDEKQSRAAMQFGKGFRNKGRCTGLTKRWRRLARFRLSNNEAKNSEE
jgi:hypothetical protein